MSVTGHRSQDSVRSYKRIATNQHKEVSRVLQQAKVEPLKDEKQASLKHQNLFLEFLFLDVLILPLICVNKIIEYFWF